MGKASTWFRHLLGQREPDAHEPASQTPPVNRDKRRRSFVRPFSKKESAPTTPAAKHSASTTNNAATSSSQYGRQHNQESVTALVDPNTHAIAVAAATAAVAEAALAAAHATVTVVRLTSSSGRCAHNSTAHFSSSHWVREELAAVNIQAAFRGYLARRALRALKGLVRLQALVRGRIERKRTAEWLWKMQALLRVQGRARAGRIQTPESSQRCSKTSQSHFHNPGPPTPEKFEHAIRSKSAKYERTSILKRNGSTSNGRIVDYDKVLACQHRSHNKMDGQIWDQIPSTGIGAADNKKDDKILEVDNVKPHLRSKCKSLFHSTHLSYAADQCGYSFFHSKKSNQIVPRLLSGEFQSLSPPKFSHEVEESSFATENSLRFYSASSSGASPKRSPFTPAKSDGSKSYLSGYSENPNYMACTESSRAKVRSLSAPKRRLQYERSSLTKRHSIIGFGESRFNTERSSLHGNYTSKAYPGSGRLDKLGMPTWQRY